MRRASPTAFSVIFDDCATWRVISLIEELSSSAEAATVCTLALASSAAAATLAAWPLVCPAVADIARAVASISVAADASSPTRLATLASKPRTSASSRAARCSLAARSASCSAASWSALIMLSLNTCTAPAMAPISSLRPRPTISAVMSRSASRRIAPVIAVIGRETPRIMPSPAIADSSAASTSAPMIQTRVEA